MKKTQTQLTLSFDLPSYSTAKRISAKQFDNLTRSLCVKLIRNGTAFSAPEGAVVTLRGTKPNGLAFDIVGTAANREKGIYNFVLDDNALAVAGCIRCDIAYFKSSVDSFLLGSTEVFEIDNIRAAIDPYAEKDAELFQSMEAVSAAISADAQIAIADVSRVAEDLLAAKANGEFKGEKGDAGYELTESDIIKIASEIPIDKTLSRSGEAADAAAVGTSLSGKAPSGYGLGESAKSTTDLNMALECGFYAFGSGCANTPFSYGTAITINRFGTQRTQIAINPLMGGKGEIAVRHYNSVWSVWEYVNPPLEVGKEYRTTKRYRGKPVYVKLIEFGALPNAAYKQITYGENGCKAISCVGLSSGGDVLPFNNNSGTGINVSAFNQYITAWAATDRSSITAEFTVEYYKTTD